MTLEEIEQRIAALTRDVAAVHSTVRDRYNALDAAAGPGGSLGSAKQVDPGLRGPVFGGAAVDWHERLNGGSSSIHQCLGHLDRY